MRKSTPRSSTNFHGRSGFFRRNVDGKCSIGIDAVGIPPVDHLVARWADTWCDKHVHLVGAAFDPRVVGLDHLAFAVKTRAELDDWDERLESLDIVRSPIVDMEGYGAVLCFRDPEQVQLELYWRSGKP